MLSPAFTSPLVALSKNCCVAEPPIADRLPVTARPVLAGLVPGVTVTVSSDEPPGGTAAGLAAPTPEGLLGPPQMLKSSLVLRGLGALAVKSLELLSVSVQPPLFLMSAVVFDRPAATAPSKQFAVP